MTKDKFKIQVGDTLYQASKSYGRVFEWEVIAIWLEDYIGGNKTIVKCSNGVWSEEFFVADILAMKRTREEAEKAIEEVHR